MEPTGQGPAERGPDRLRPLGAILRPPTSATDRQGAAWEQAACKRCGGAFSRARPGAHPFGVRLYCDGCVRGMLKAEQDQRVARMVELRTRMRTAFPYGLRSRTFADFRECDAARVVREWAEGFPARRPHGYRSLHICGDHGLGKTHLAAAAVNLILERWSVEDPHRDHLAPVLYVEALKLLARIRATFSQDAVETEEDVFESLRHAPLVVVDDVLKESLGEVLPRAHALRVYFRLVDERYSERLPLMLVSNANLLGERQPLGEATTSRLAEMTERHFVQVTGADRRWGGA